MKRTLFKTRFNHFITLTIFCIILWMIRVKLSHSLFMGFLLWNLFLAYIPYGLSNFIKSRLHKLRKFILIIVLFIWLLFLPNAPYIITDFIHLHQSDGNIIWLDIFILFAFASTGLLFAITSLLHIYKIIQQKWNSNFANCFSLLVTFLCGFGIYLGRFLRFNSWDVFTNPMVVLNQSLTSANDPKTWFITISFGSFLYILFLLYKHLKLDKV